MLGNILNSILVILFGLYLVRFIKKTKAFSVMLALHIMFSFWQLCSVAFIEVGVYNLDLLTDTYFNFSTLRLFVFEIAFFETMLFCYKRSKIARLEFYTESLFFDREKYHQLIVLGTSVYAAYYLLNLMLSENIFTNSAVTRFNFYSSYSVLPFALLMSYFALPVILMLGCVFAYSKKVARRYSTVPLLFVIALCSYGTGNEFGVLLYLFVYFFTPILIKKFNNIEWKTTKEWFSKLIKRYNKAIVLALLIIIAASVVKIKSFEKVNIFSEYASSPISAFFYRALALQGDVWWAVDTKVLGGFNEFSQLFNEIKGCFGRTDPQSVGIFYLMKLILPSNRFDRYIWGNATLTAGYPALNIAIFGYIGGIIVCSLEAIFFFNYIKYVYTKLLKMQYVRLFLAFYVYLQLHKVYNICGYHNVTNLIPVIFAVLLAIIETISGTRKRVRDSLRLRNFEREI